MPVPSFRCALVLDNLVDGATVTASSSAGSISPDRVKSGFIAKKWKSGSNSDTLDFDFGSGGVSIDSIWVGGLTATGVRFYLDEDDDTFAAPNEDSGAIVVNQNYNSAVYLLDAPVTRQFLRIALSHSSLSYVEAGRVFVGVRSTFAYNFDIGASMTPADPSVRSVTLGSGIRVERRPRFRMWDLPMGALVESDRDAIIEKLDREKGLSEEFLLLINPVSDNLPKDTALVFMENGTPVFWTGQWIDGQRVFSKTLSVREQL